MSFCPSRTVIICKVNKYINNKYLCIGIFCFDFFLLVVMKLLNETFETKDKLVKEMTVFMEFVLLLFLLIFAIGGTILAVFKKLCRKQSV